jgi:predicted DCC family thiol-disulfide oxidoreductase YuxK
LKVWEKYLSLRYKSTKMKKATISDKTIIYDDACPLCAAYTGVFLKTGMLEKRLAFTDMGETMLCQFDPQRAKNEIPLVDVNGGATLYGLDSLLYILGKRFPFVTVIFKVKAIDWFFRKLYKLVSYNRKVIIPAAAKATGFDCTPDFNIKYRLLYIFLAALAATLLSTGFALHMPVYATENMLLVSLSIAGAKWTLLAMLGAFAYRGKRLLEFAGQLVTICLIGSLLLVPGIFVKNDTLFFINLVVSVLVMTKEMYRRLRLTGFAKGWWTIWLLILTTAVTMQYFLLSGRM